MKLTFWDTIFVITISLFCAYAMNILFQSRDYIPHPYINYLTVDPDGYVIGIERILPNGKINRYTIYSPWNYEQIKLLRKQGILRKGLR